MPLKRLGLLLALAACSAPIVVEHFCKPGSGAACACADGAMGTTTCLDSGTEFGRCDCIKPCAPTSTKACTCESGVASTQVCGPDAGYGACQCVPLSCRQTCDGCCLEDGTCIALSSINDLHCGTNAAECSVCSGGAHCQSGGCVPQDLDGGVCDLGSWCTSDGTLPCASAVPLDCAGPILAMDADDTYVAWSDSGGHIRAWKKPNGPSFALASQMYNVESIAVGGGQVFWVQSSTGYRVSPVVGMLETFNTALSSPLQIVYFGGTLYLTNLSGQNVSRITPDGGIEVLFSVSTPPAISLAVSPGALYWASPLQGVISAGGPDGGAQALVFQGEQGADHLTWSNGYLFWTTGSTTGGVHYGYSPGAVGVVAENQSMPIDVQFDGTRVYWANAGMLGGQPETGLRSSTLDGGATRLELQVSFPTHLRMDPTSFYLGTQNGVWRVPR